MSGFAADTQPVVSHGEVSIGGTYFRLDGMVRRSLISIIPGKLVVGDATRGDSQLSSSWNLADSKGGLLVERAIPSRDIDRGYIGTSETRYQNAIGLAQQVDEFPKPVGADDAAIIFEFNDNCYVAFGTSLRIFNTATNTWTALATLPAVPTDWRYFAGRLYIACGDAQPVQIFNGTTTANAVDGGAVTIAGTHLEVLDTKLFVMQASGAMQSIVDTGTLTYGSEGALDRYQAGNEVVGLLIFHDLNGSPLLYASTRRGFSFYDLNEKMWRPTQLTLPRHRYGGAGNGVFRGETYYSAGLTAFKFNLTTISSVGLDRDDGLPSSQDGNIVAFVPGVNFLYTFVQARDQAVGTSSPIQFGSPYQPYIMPASQAFSTLWSSDGNGIWHYLWGSRAPSGITASGIVTHNSVTRLWWCADHTMYSLLLPPGIHNPLHNPAVRFQPASYHITPWFDADWAEEPKIAIRLRIGVAGLSATERIRVLVGFDDDEGFAMDLGYVDATTERTPTGVIQFTFGEGIGRVFYRIRFRFEFVRGSDATKSPTLRFFTLNYLKGIEPIYGYDLTLDLMVPVKGQSPAQQRDAIEAISGAKTLVALRYKDEAGDAQQRIVRVTRFYEVDGTGTDDRGKIQLSLGEVYAH